MMTIALRFGEMFSPECGTIAAHQNVIDSIGFVWYGKLGSAISPTIIDEMMKSEDPKFLLIKSGKTERYWVHFNAVSRSQPSVDEYPSYYGNKTVRMSTWFKVTEFEQASKNVMSHCYVCSSGNSLSEASRLSMSPYFIIEYKEDDK